MTVDEAAALEAEAEEHPEERGEILLEAAAAWRRAGRAERASELLAELVAAGGEDACYARFELAEGYFEDGAVGEAYAELTALSREAALNDGHCRWQPSCWRSAETLKMRCSGTTAPLPG